MKDKFGRHTEATWVALMLAAAFVVSVNCQAAELDPVIGTGICNSSFEQIWINATIPVSNRVEQFREAVAGYQQIRAELLNERLWLGLGPSAASEDALRASQALGAVEAIASVTSLGGWVGMRVATSSPKVASGLWKSIDKWTELFGYALDAKDVRASDGVAELAWAMTKAVANVAAPARQILAIGDAVIRHFEIESQYKSYVAEISRQVQRLDVEIARANLSLAQEEARYRAVAAEAFRRACRGTAGPASLEARTNARGRDSTKNATGSVVDIAGASSCGEAVTRVIDSCETGDGYVDCALANHALSLVALQKRRDCSAQDWQRFQKGLEEREVRQDEFDRSKKCAEMSATARSMERDLGLRAGSARADAERSLGDYRDRMRSTGCTSD